MACPTYSERIVNGTINTDPKNLQLDTTEGASKPHRSMLKSNPLPIAPLRYIAEDIVVDGETYGCVKRNGML